MKKLNHQELMDKAYNRWADGEFKSLSLKDFFEKLPVLEQTAVALGNLNYQVGNGGFYQWEDNGYKDAHKDFLKQLERLIPYKDFPQLLAAIKLVHLATTRKNQELCDDIYYSLSGLKKQMNDYILSIQ